MQLFLCLEMLGNERKIEFVIRSAQRSLVDTVVESLRGARVDNLPTRVKRRLTNGHDYHDLALDL